MHRFGHGRTGDEVATELREHDPFADGIRLVAATSNALQAARHRGRRFDLHDEIDRAHVDAELERRGGHECLDMAGFQQILDVAALRARDRAVVGSHERFARKLVERAREALGKAAAVDEQQRRTVLANELEQPRMDGCPDRRTGARLRRGAARHVDRLREPGQILDGHLNPQCNRFLVRRVDDRDGAEHRRALVPGELVVQLRLDLFERHRLARLRLAGRTLPAASAGPRFGAAEKTRNLVERPLRCRQANALQRWTVGLRAQRLEPLDRQRQMRAARGRESRRRSPCRRFAAGRVRST